MHGIIVVFVYTKGIIKRQMHEAHSSQFLAVDIRRKNSIRKHKNDIKYVGNAPIQIRCGYCVSEPASMKQS